MHFQAKKPGVPMLVYNYAYGGATTDGLVSQVNVCHTMLSRCELVNILISFGRHTCRAHKQRLIGAVPLRVSDVLHCQYLAKAMIKVSGLVSMIAALQSTPSMW